jgi:hypothetical protein
VRHSVKLRAAAAAVVAALVLVPSAAQAGNGEVAILTVNKVVVGDPGTSSGFVIEVDCTALEGENGIIEEPIEVLQDTNYPEPFSTALEFGPEGGSQDVVFDGPYNCTVTETDTGGATTVTGEGTVAIEAPIAYSITITNTFVAPDTLAPTTTEETRADTVARPRFTG